VSMMFVLPKLQLALAIMLIDVVLVSTPNAVVYLGRACCSIETVVGAIVRSNVRCRAAEETTPRLTPLRAVSILETVRATLNCLRTE
jgi:hypothetical protein